MKNFRSIQEKEVNACAFFLMLFQLYFGSNHKAVGILNKRLIIVAMKFTKKSIQKFTMYMNQLLTCMEWMRAQDPFVSGLTVRLRGEFGVRFG